MLRPERHKNFAWSQTGRFTSDPWEIVPMPVVSPMQDYAEATRLAEKIAWQRLRPRAKDDSIGREALSPNVVASGAMKQRQHGPMQVTAERSASDKIGIQSPGCPNRRLWRKSGARVAATGSYTLAWLVLTVLSLCTRRSRSQPCMYNWRSGHNTVRERYYGSDATSRYSPKPNSTMPIASSNRPKK